MNNELMSILYKKFVHIYVNEVLNVRNGWVLNQKLLICRRPNTMCKALQIPLRFDFHLKIDFLLFSPTKFSFGFLAGGKIHISEKWKLKYLRLDPNTVYLPSLQLNFVEKNEDKANVSKGTSQEFANGVSFDLFLVFRGIGC